MRPNDRKDVNSGTQLGGKRLALAFQKRADAKKEKGGRRRCNRNRNKVEINDLFSLHFWLFDVAASIFPVRRMQCFAKP